MEELVVGTIFDKMGSWYRQIVAIEHQTDEYAFVDVVEDDGLKQYFIFKKNADGKWQSFMSSTDRDYFYQEYQKYIA